MATTSTWGLTYPAPSDAPDGPGGIYALAQSVEAAIGLRRCCLQLNGARSTGANGADISWDTVISDPLNMRDTAGGQGIKATWTGRYFIGARAALQGDIPTSNFVWIDSINTGGNVLGRTTQYGLPGDNAMQYFDEVTINAGDVIRFRMGWTGSTGARQLSYGTDYNRARIFARYLGPA